MTTLRGLRGLALVGLVWHAGVADATLVLSREADAPVVRIWGSRKYDWFLEASPDLRTWSALPGQPPLIANRTNPPPRRLPVPGGPGAQFLRARQTDGLYDLSLLRTISLTFIQANWQTRLTQGRTTGSNTPALFVMDNGAQIEGVGARFRGNTSFTGGPGGGAPTRKSLNLELDFSDPDAHLLGYRTLNLNNAYGDETILREPLFFSIMRQYAICPRASLVQLFINGEYWGVYSCASSRTAT